MGYEKLITQTGGGYENRTRDPLLAGQVLIPAELIPHILQNISRAIYLLSASTLLSWSTSHTASYLNLIFRLNKKHQATYFANISNFLVALRE